MEYANKYVKEMVQEMGYKKTSIDIGVSETSVRNWLNKGTEMNIYNRTRVEDAYKLFKGAEYWKT